MLKKGLKNIPVLAVKGNAPIQDRLQILNQKERYAVLATESDGQPYTALIAYALTDNLKGVVFATPKNTCKFKNILKNPRVSILIDSRTNSSGDYLSIESVTVAGTARSLRKGRKWDESAAVLVKKHPQLSDFIVSSTTALILTNVTHYVHVCNFQDISEWHIK
ncbi:MAG: pyridoxamine 5'-phosphate oxidase family protein [Candidatus Loosdrechtia sp.]|uniref:pyridoxamine 5'-phosphate oxidase family protein n=1 Tax=Candidatus Loosdrechtia sp. TaxID=3101272 RepID=UPI003A756D6E|nr:MAG: pyridoxamine 5'-phosphate oxidase family protein [Candidatus Jettenia sp. AMX2]